MLWHTQKKNAKQTDDEMDVEMGGVEHDVGRRLLDDLVPLLHTATDEASGAPFLQSELFEVIFRRLHSARAGLSMSRSVKW